MAEPDILRLLRRTRWDHVATTAHDHAADLVALTDGDVAALLTGEHDGDRAGDHPTTHDLWTIVQLHRTGAGHLIDHLHTFVRSEAGLAFALSSDDREDLLTDGLTSGLIVASAIDHPAPALRLVPLADQVRQLPRPSTQVTALAATASSRAFDLTGDVRHADAAVDDFRAVVAPPDGLGPLDDRGLNGARVALALVLAGRDRAVTGRGASGSSGVVEPAPTHADLLEAIAIMRAAADALDPPLTAEQELATNTLLTLLAELFQVTGDLSVVDEALTIVTRLAERPPTVAQLAAQVLWLRLRHDRSRDPDDLTRALLAIDEALTRAVTDDDPAAAAEVDGLRRARQQVLLALTDLRKGPREQDD